MYTLTRSCFSFEGEVINVFHPHSDLSHNHSHVMSFSLLVYGDITTFMIDGQFVYLYAVGWGQPGHV